ncbi:MAG: kinase/pyrophosphorylase, partial [Myxococcota bacterium]|nr:kinase/pyrophosphorylase [Myxococcota bacterium]
MPKPIFIISDGTGDTAEKSVRAALLQFQGYLVHVQTFPHVTEPEQLGQLFRVAARSRALVATTLVRSEMRSAAQRLAKEHRIRTVDLMGDLLELLTGYLQAQPEGVPGRMHRADEFYFKRIEAVEFTVKADDGKELR